MSEIMIYQFLVIFSDILYTPICDCHDGIKGHLCHHTMALTYDRNKEFPIDPRLNAFQFTKQKAGRPKKHGLALTREPPLVPGNDAHPEEALPGPARGRGQPGGAGARGGMPGRARVRGGLHGRAMARGGQAGRIRVRGGLLADVGRLERTVVVPSSVWSSFPNVLGNIQVNDVGELSQEEEEGDAEGLSSQEEGGEGATSQDEEPEEIDLELDL